MNAGVTAQGRRVNRRHSPAERERLIEEQKASGLGRREFCERIGLNVMTFHSWFRAGQKNKKAKTVGKPFVEVAMPQQITSSGAEIEIELTNGAHVWIRANGSNRELGRLIREVAGCCRPGAA